MLTKRIIPCLDIKDGRTVKGVNFVQLRDAGDPVELAKIYSDEGADELVFLDITATVDKRKTLAELVTKVAKAINIPFTVGGGISTVEDVKVLLGAGADKISINSAAVKNPGVIDEMAAEFGSQCIVVAIDTRDVDGTDYVHTHGGRKPTLLQTQSWAKEVADRGAGEILLTSMDHDGTKAGFANEITAEISSMLTIPVIASGGAGKMHHFEEVFSFGKADAALAASIFHFKEIPVPELKSYLVDRGVSIRF
ncbi:imidazole glycerol phosphate synthase subunit HisF [Algoriphagus sediminis]|uniref:Imidazole glycerol phosphate synthase subunit HisF n=1 Tax=Algoriphagus sediminis TaxID=3057113 RepID=A0ABT7YI06_9BACT|nr:imidazole glycerol phosphate synthase subunit HisF [Algoriphagus sediminis]MDN3205784.1 imidazole glycerol phosphate synthase subunit HisF [Algoriphagus sediminis]